MGAEKLFRTSRFGLKGWAPFVFASLCGVALVWGAQTLQLRSVFSNTERYLREDHPILAAEYVKEHRTRLVSSETGCRLALQALLAAGQIQDLEWTAEACEDQKIVTSPVYLAKALVVLETAKQVPKAIELLTRVSAAFPDDPSIQAKLAKLLVQNGQPQEAKAAMLKATDQAPNNAQLAFDALLFFSRINTWPEAKLMADRIKGVKEVSSPEVKILIAQVFLKAGDRQQAAILAQEAKLMLALNPESGRLLLGRYPEVFSLLKD